MNTDRNDAGLIFKGKQFVYDYSLSVVITRDHECRFEGNILFLALRYFLLAN